MDESTKTSPCKELKDGDSETDLVAEVEHLRQHLTERDSHIIALEEEFLRCTSKANELEEQLSNWREKYDRLHDSHKRVQKLNQVLEDKLLQMVDKMKGDKTQLTKDIATLSVRLAESKHNVSLLQKENERYKNDMNLAIQLLQCKPDNFVSQKLDNLPVDTQARVSQYVMAKTKGTPPAQSKNGNEPEVFDTSDYEFNISASLMSKILEDSIQDTVTKHCDTCTCGKAQNKPFSYDETHYSVSTQTAVDTQKHLCVNCNAEVKSAHSNPSITSLSSQADKHFGNDKNLITPKVSPLYLIPQNVIPKNNTPQDKCLDNVDNVIVNTNHVKILSEPKTRSVAENPICVNVDIYKINEDFKQLRHTINNMEPQVHHKACEKPRNSVTSIKDRDDTFTNESTFHKEIPINTTNSENNGIDRKNSHSSMGAISRTSSVAKSTSSTHKSNTQVGPGPRFCSLRMQAGSKNILLDNAQPDVPPVLYKRQSKCSENIFSELTDLNVSKNDEKGNVVVESTLVDVHVDNNNKDVASSKNSSINPILMNVSSSPLQPLKTHSFSNGSENNNSAIQTNGDQILSQVNNLLSGFNGTKENKTIIENKSFDLNLKTDDVNADTNEIQIFNFDRYEQNKMTKQYAIRKIDMSNLHTIENTKISKDLSPQGELPKLTKKLIVNQKPSLPAVGDIYTNLTQTHLKANDIKKVFTNEQSTSSLSSDDSAAMLQKQQLLRVAEWVEQNLEQQNNLNNPLTLDEDVNSNKTFRRDSKLKLADTLELALNMPHPVSKYSKAFVKDEGGSWLVDNVNLHKTDKQTNALSEVKTLTVKSIAKETIFPADDAANSSPEIDNGNKMDNNLNDVFRRQNGDNITPEELARMEYNVKKFLLSGPQWGNTETYGRSRRTSSKTETDV